MNRGSGHRGQCVFRSALSRRCMSHAGPTWRSLLATCVGCRWVSLANMTHYTQQGWPAPPSTTGNVKLVDLTIIADHVHPWESRKLWERWICHVRGWPRTNPGTPSVPGRSCRRSERSRCRRGRGCLANAGRAQRQIAGANQHPTSTRSMGPT